LSSSGGILLQGLYFFKLQRWLQIFSKEQLLILQSEDFFENPAKTMQQVWQFLEVPGVIDFKYYKLNIGAYPPVEPSIRQELAEFFYSYNQQLEEYLQRKFNWNISH